MTALLVAVWVGAMGAVHRGPLLGRRQPPLAEPLRRHPHQPEPPGRHHQCARWLRPALRGIPRVGHQAHATAQVAVCCLLFAVCCLLFAVCCLPILDDEAAVLDILGVWLNDLGN